MEKIPKPKHCHQSWLDMKSTDQGRICEKCEKVIVDFSKKSWSEIEKVQRQSNNTVCGMYRAKQLENWGQETPGYRSNLLKVATVAGLSISISLSAYAQSSASVDSILVEGLVTDKETGEVLPFVKLRLRNRKAGAETNLNGEFRIVVENTSEKSLTDTLELFYIDYSSVKIVFNDIRKLESSNENIQLEEGKLNIALTQSTEEITNYYVSKPSLKDRIKWRFRNWFGRKE